MKGVKKNLIYNVVYQILALILPLITIPYVSRKLGVQGLGIYSYTYSIVFYFMIIAMLGINNYGNRTIAKIRNDKIQLSKAFKEIHLLQIITSFIMTIFYLVFLLVENQYKSIFLIQFIYLISCFFDINWFFFGLEKFKITVIRSSIIKALALILIFTLVKSKSDLWIYTCILSLSTLLSQIVLWGFVKKELVPIKIKFSDIKKHFLPCLKLFLPVIAVTIYKVMDKTMIGLLSNVKEVGYYENAEKIINVPVAIITAMGTVMLPRMSNIYANNKEKNGNEIIEKSIKFAMFISIAMMAGLIAVSKNFSIVYFGKEFEKSGSIIDLLSITTIFLTFGNVLRTQYLIPKERDKIYIISAYIGAIINFFLNIIFIPIYGSIGACFGTIAAEFSVMIYQANSIKHELPIKRYAICTIPYFVKALIMFSIVYSINYVNISIILKLFLQIIIGVLVYVVLNIKYIKSIINFDKLF